MKNNIKNKIVFIPIYIFFLFLPKIIGILFASNGEITDFLSLVAINIFYVFLLIILISFLFSKKSVVDFHKNLFLNLVVMGISTFFILGILEVFARIMADEETLTYQRLTGTQQRQTIPPPLQGSDYDVPWFMENFISAEIEILDYPNHKTAKYLKDQISPFFTIKNNRRYTTNTPQLDSLSKLTQNKLYIFGGSTIFCREVPDSLTISSYLQRFISEKYPTMEVVNCGIQGIHTPIQLANLEIIKDSLKKDDIVIFYDGVNNSFSGISHLEKQFEETSYQSNTIVSSVMSFLYTFRERLFILLHQKSMLVNWLLYPYIPKEPTFIAHNLKQNPKFIEGIDSVATSYAEDIGKAAILCKEREVKFFHFLQPQLDSRTPKTDFEKMAFIDNPYKRIRYDVVYFNLCYPFFREKLDSLRINHNINTKDISAIFNDYPEDIYLDFCHVSQKGNIKVAQKIAEDITK